MSDKPRELRECVGLHTCPYDDNLIRELHAETAVQRTKIEGIEEGVHDIKQCLMGNGKPGLVLRMDRLEQKDKTRSRVLWTIFGIVTTAIVGFVATALGFTM